MGFAVLVTMSLTSLWLARESDRAMEIVAHTLEVNSTIVTYQGALRRAESGERGFLLTGEEAYLDDYRAGQRRLVEIQRQLQALIADNPDQQARFQAVLPLIDYDATLKGELSRAGFVTRDAREVERKKVGLHGARRRKQFSKR